MWSGLRIRAPALQRSEELRWVLLRAFAPVDVIAPRVDARAVVRLSRALDLAARIATRHPATTVQELGSEAARELSFHRLQVVAIDRVLSMLSAEILVVARTLACPVVWMKHAALRRVGRVAEGERAARDLDLLVPQELAGALQKALIARGFRSAEGSPEMHLPPLLRAPGEVVELHRALWGIKLPGQAQTVEGASASELVSERLVEGMPDGSYVPIKPLLAAHAVVHGLVQHRSSPEGYPIMRVLADLCSLGPIDTETRKQCQTLAASRSASELSLVAVRLSDALSSGADVLAWPATSPELGLLSHVVASALDPAYRRALRFERIFDLASADTVLRTLRSVFSNPEGPSQHVATQGMVQRLNWRAPRPVSLALELARGAVSYAALRSRRRTR